MAKQIKVSAGDSVGILVCCDRDDPDHTSAAVICNQQRIGILDSSRIVPVEHHIEWVDDINEALHSLWCMADYNLRDMRDLTANLAVYTSVRKLMMQAKMLPKTVVDIDKTTWNTSTWNDFDKRTPLYAGKFCRFVGLAFGKDHEQEQRRLLRVK